jgi:surfactin synthase thioesterase subunit
VFSNRLTFAIDMHIQQVPGASVSMVQLFCFPYAGAGASAYLRWRRLAPAWLDVIPVELPGHGQRWSEPLVTDMPQLIQDLQQRVRPAVVAHVG